MATTNIVLRLFACREQLLFPLQFTGKLGEVDIIAAVEGGGESCRAGAIRLAMSRALQSFVPEPMVEKMRLGLIWQDVDDEDIWEIFSL